MPACRAPHVVADKLREIRVPLGRLGSTRERLIADMHARALDGLAQCVRHFIDGNVPKLLALGTLQVGQSLVVQQIEHPGHDAGKHKGDVLPLANHELHA